MTAGCSGTRGKTKSPARPAAAASKSAPAKPAAFASQKEAYDRGMKYYTQEQYKEARKAWQEAVRLGPSTQLGRQAQKYLEDVEKTLQTLQGINSQ